MKLHHFYLIVCTVCLIAGCDTPTDGFERTNNLDAFSPDYRIGTVTGLQVSADSNGIITVRWGESDEIVSKNVLEKSLGDTLNFVTIAELKPELLQFADSSLEVKTNTYYRLTSYIEQSGGDNRVYKSSQITLSLNSISNLTYDFLNEENSLRLKWNTDHPFFSHFIISSDNILSEQQEKSINIPAVGLNHSFIDPLLDIDFNNRNYTITGVIEYNETQEIVTGESIIFDPATFFQPENLEVNILNEQDWEISWGKAPFFASNIEVIRLHDPQNRTTLLPQESTSFIDSLIIGTSEFRFLRRYQVRFVTSTSSSRQVTGQAVIHFQNSPSIMGSNSFDTDPTVLRLIWDIPEPERDLVKAFIIERLIPHPNPQLSGRFIEVARVDGETYEYTFHNVNQAEQNTYRVRTLVSQPSRPVKFAFTYDYKKDYSFNVPMTHVTSMEVTSDGRYLAAVSFRSDSGNSILITDIISEQEVSRISIPSHLISDIKISPDENFIYFSVPTQGAIYKADFPSGNSVVKLIDDASLNSFGVRHIDVSKDGSFIVGTGGLGFVKKWDLNTLEPIFTFFNTTSTTIYAYKNISISPNSAYIGSNNGLTYIMNADTGTIIHSFSIVSQYMSNAQFSYDSKYFSFASVFFDIRVYSAENWELVRTFANSGRAHFHPEKPQMVIVDTEMVYIYDLEESKIIGIITDEFGSFPRPTMNNAITFIDDDRIAMVVGNNIQIWSKKESKTWKINF